MECPAIAAVEPQCAPARKLAMSLLFVFLRMVILSDVVLRDWCRRTAPAIDSVRIQRAFSDRVAVGLPSNVAATPTWR
jgi:hypothetical protein